ncbi:MAG TPA: OsmC family protein [Gemmatimonadales bacterium]
MSHRRAVALEWLGKGMQFSAEGTDPVAPAITIDGDGETGPSPMLTLLMAAAACSASDVVHILQKMRVKLRGLRLEVDGIRRTDEPRRYMSIGFRYLVAGDGVTLPQAERAVALSLEKYCSVVHTLAPDVVLTHEVRLG